MTDGHCFISYSTADALEFAEKLANELAGGYPSIPVWFDKRNLRPGMEWDIQIDDGLKGCKLVLFVMTKDSTNEKSVCKQEWSRALSYKKLVIPILLQQNINTPFRLGDRQRIDFTRDFEAGISQLRRHIAWLASPEGVLQDYKDRLADAERDIQRASASDKLRIQADIDHLVDEIKRQEEIVKNPQKAQEQTQKNIETGLERERKPEKPTAAQTSTKFINPPPGIAPMYFQDRLSETRQVVDFFNDNSQRLMTIIGRGGIGKTAMICRLLKGIEVGQLPDNLGEMNADGIVYLSEAGSHRVNFTNIFYDLCKLLPSPKAQDMDAVYKNPQASTESKMRALLDQFSAGQIMLLLDNVETLINVETFDIGDAELNECLRAFLHGSHSPVKIVMTTRIAPRGLNLYEPGRQRIYHLEEGLPSPYAEKMLRELDVDGTLGFKEAKDELLDRARLKTRGFPKGLEALKQILASDRYTTLDELLAMPLPENVVEALVGEAFNRLDANAQKVMQALAVYNRPVTPAAVDYLLASHIPAMDSAPILQRLANMHFARKESGRFYLHPVDREFAFGLIAEKDLTTTPKELGQADTKVTKEEQKSLFQPFLSKRQFSFPNYHLLFTKHDLTSRAADYFAQARKPRAEWKKLEDLSAQLAEFDLRCAAGDFDTAASVLKEVDFDYLLMWGHYRLTIDLHEKLSGKIGEKQLAMICAESLGSAYYYIGKARETVRNYELALAISHETKNRWAEQSLLGNIGSAYAVLGNTSKAIDFIERALVISDELGYRKGKGTELSKLGNRYFGLGDSIKAIEFHEQASTIHAEVDDHRYISIDLDNIGLAYLDLNQYDKAESEFLKSIQVADKIPYPYVQNYAREGLTKAYLFQNDLVNARATIKTALEFDVPQNNHNASALHGIIALRQGDEVTARGAFVRAIGQADEILSKTAEYYSALDAKGLVICGLVICDGRGDPSMPAKTNDGKIVPPDMTNANAGRVAPTVEDAIETFQKARKIAPHAGIVKSVLRLFDELVKCDSEGILKDVRKAVEGVE